MKITIPFKHLAISLALLGTQLPSAESAAKASAAPVASTAGADLAACGVTGGMPAARAKARKLVRQIREDLAATEDQIRMAPFIAEVESGSASVELITAVVAEEYSIIHSDMDSFSRMASRWDTAGGSHFFGDLAYGEALALPLVIDFAATAGLTEPDLVSYEPRPRSQTYPSRVAWIANNADRAAAAASFLVNFAVFGENMGRIRDALLDVYGFTPAEVEFFTFFADPIPGFEDDAVEVIAAGLLEGACPRDARRSARLLQAYELDFWQAASDAPGSPLPVTR